MEVSDPRPLESPPYRHPGLRALILAILALAAGALLVFWPVGPGSQRGTGMGGRLDAGLAAEAREALERAAARVQPGDPDLPLLDEALRRRSRAELGAMQDAAPAAALAMEQATRRSQELMADVLVRRGATAYRELVALLALRTVAALEAALPGLATAGGVQPYLAGHAQGSAVRRDFDELYGSFLLRVALPSGLVRPDGQADPDLLPYARVIVAYRLLQEAARLARVELAPGEAEQRVFLRWKVERATLASLESRLRALRELQRLEPKYRAPADLAGRSDH